MWLSEASQQLEKLLTSQCLTTKQTEKDQLRLCSVHLLGLTFPVDNGLSKTLMVSWAELDSENGSLPEINLYAYNLSDKKCEHYKLHWKEYLASDKLDTFTNKRRYHEVLKTYSIIGGLCQNIGIAISDYSRLHSQIESSIRLQDKDFTRPLIADPEITVSERLSRLTQELENCLLANPTESILGFAAVRMTLESYIRIKIQDKMRQNIRIRNCNNNLDIKFTSKLRPIDIRKTYDQLFTDENEFKALEKIYSLSSMTVHRAIPIANYLNWGSLTFVLDTLEKKISRSSRRKIRIYHVRVRE